VGFFCILFISIQSGLLVGLELTGHDDESGIERFDVEYWEESKGWTDLLTNTPDTEAWFVGEAGVNYAVRVKVRDQVGNKTQAEKTMEVLDVVKCDAFKVRVNL
jgi:hypothetical protein